MVMVQGSVVEHQTAILDMILSGHPLNNILRFIAQSMELHCERNTLFGSIMLFNASSNQLEQTVSGSLPQSFINSIAPIDVSPYGGSSGAAAFFKYPVLVSDIENNPIWKAYSDLAMSHHLRACWSSPLLSSSGELLGTIELYSIHVNGISQELIEQIETYRLLAARAIETAQQHKNKHLLF